MLKPNTCGCALTNLQTLSSSNSSLLLSHASFGSRFSWCLNQVHVVVSWPTRKRLYYPTRVSLQAMQVLVRGCLRHYNQELQAAVAPICLGPYDQTWALLTKYRRHGLDKLAQTLIIHIKPFLKPCHPFLVTFKTRTKKRWVFLDQFAKIRIIKK